MIHRTICRDGRDQSILMGGFFGSSCRIITVPIYGGASFWRMTLLLCAGLMPSWWPSRAAAARSKWWADPPSECIRVTPLSGMIIVFFVYYFSSFGSFLIRLSCFFFFSCVSIFALDIHIWTKSIFNTLRLALMEISSPTCAPLTHTQFISAPNWAYKYPLFLPFSLYTRRYFFADARATGFRSLDRSTMLSQVICYAYEERRDHKMSLLLWGLCRPSISRLYIISQDLLFLKINVVSLFYFIFILSFCPFLFLFLLLFSFVSVVFFIL